MHLVELLIERDYQSTKTSQLRQTWFAQAEEMAQCLHIHRQSYGIKHIPSQVTDAVQTALQALVNHLEDFDGAEQVFIEIWRFGVALGQKFKSTAETIKTIRFLSRKESVELPREAIAILDGTECWAIAPSFRLHHAAHGTKPRPDHLEDPRRATVRVQGIQYPIEGVQ